VRKLPNELRGHEPSSQQAVPRNRAHRVTPKRTGEPLKAQMSEAELHMVTSRL
jgi:hypothetical protein